MILATHAIVKFHSQMEPAERKPGSNDNRQEAEPLSPSGRRTVSGAHPSSARPKAEKPGGKKGNSNRTPLQNLLNNSNGQVLILKVGTSSLMEKDADGQQVNITNLAKLVDLIHKLRKDNYQVVLVSSGAVGMGCIKLGIPKPTSLRTKQAVAAAGQSQLMRLYEDLFSVMGVKVAQLLLSQIDFLDKNHWNNVRHTLAECLNLNLMPIINENDSTSTEELRFGDNDNLAALTAVQLQADWLVLFTDVDYLFTANPRVDPSATALKVVPEPWSLQVDTRAEGSGMGTGGMATKIVAARMATSAGINCALINGKFPERLNSFLKYSMSSDRDQCPVPEGTFFMRMEISEVSETRRWILSLRVSGELLVDDGAAKAIGDNKSLFPAGILNVSGNFTNGEAVRILHRNGDGDVQEIARALVDYMSEHLQLVKGKHSSEFDEILGFSRRPEACYRRNIVLTTAAASLTSKDTLGKLNQQNSSQDIRRCSGSISDFSDA